MIMVDNCDSTMHQEDEKQQKFEEICRKSPLEDKLGELKSNEGFPIGRDEDIIAISDSPYFTACPNPYINDFIRIFGKPYSENDDTYAKTPFEGDVSESKSGIIYYAHSYHTKVPHKAIMRYINHYTEPGDIVFDGFCGTGMTGVAALLSGRKGIISDLSSSAAYIAHNYTSGIERETFRKRGFEILREVEDETQWMFETFHTDGKTRGKINYTIYSDVYICPFCKNEYIYYNAAFNEEDRKLSSNYPCPHCGAEIKKGICENVISTSFDHYINQTIESKKQVPVLINYSVGKERYDKKPDDFDRSLIQRIEDSTIPYWVPTDQFGVGDITKNLTNIGITHIHHIYPKRNLWILASFYDKIRKSECNHLLFVLSALNIHITKRRIFQPDKPMGTPALPGTLFVPSISVDYPVTGIFKRKLNDIYKAFGELSKEKCVVGIHSATNISTIPHNSIDYIFTDPPFGSNLMYSELNFIWEAWLKVFTSNKSEAIMNKSQNKDLIEYKSLMISSFKEFNRILKPNRWITVEFHNSKASVWNAIQDSLTKAGFIVALVSVLDKKGHFKHAMSPGGVKNDLIIHAYKPHQAFQSQILKRVGEDMEIEFIIEHLRHLAVKPNIERTEQMLFSKMIAHYIQNGFEIHLNAYQFYNLLRDHFKHIDGYWFLKNEVTQYDEWKKEHGLQAIEEIAKGQQTLFVSDEKSMLVWLYNFLYEPKSYSDIYTASRQVISTMEDQLPELKKILETNFIFENGTYRRPESDYERNSVEIGREKDLLKTFERILEEARTGRKKIKEIRKEAIALGFTKAYQEKRYYDILMVAKRLDKQILENNSEINDFVEIAEMKVGDGI